MILRFFFPLLAAMGADEAQRFIARMRRRVGIAMLPDARIVTRRNHQFSAGRAHVQTGIDGALIIGPIRRHASEPLLLNVGTATTVGVVTSAREGGVVQVQLKRPVCADKGDRVAVSRRIGARWRLIGVGTIIE